VIGDGAVGLSAVLAAKRLGAEQTILMGRHTDRTDLGREFGATDVDRFGFSCRFPVRRSGFSHRDRPG